MGPGRLLAGVCRASKRALLRREAAFAQNRSLAKRQAPGTIQQQRTWLLRVRVAQVALNGEVFAVAVQGELAKAEGIAGVPS